MSALSGMQLVEALEQHPITYDGRPVVTFAVVARMHGVAEDTVRGNFYKHREHFEEGEDFVRVPVAALSGNCDSQSQLGGRPKIALTEQGYLLLVKPLSDDTSWQIQKRLARTYWRAQQQTEDLRHLKDHCARLESALLAVLNARERESRTRASDHGRGLSGRKAEIAMQKQARDLIGQPFWSAADLFGQEYLGVDEHGQLTTEPRQIEGDTEADHASS